MAYYDFEPRRRERPPVPPTPWAVLGGMLIFAVLVGVTLWGLGLFPFGQQAPVPHNPNVKEREVAPATAFHSDELERIRVYDETLPSVVNVDTLAFVARGVFNNETERNIGSGTGFFWDETGRIVTNFHVVRDALAIDNNKVIINPARKIMVTLATDETIPAQLVGIAPDNDLAVIQLSKLPKNGVKPIAVGESNKLKVGQTVYAIGSPFGQQFTFSNGIISALKRKIQSPTDHLIDGAIQTNAALNPGNSGGPLLDKDGRLIGVNTAITTPSGGSVGIGYAIPVDTVNKTVTEIVRNGRVAQALYRDRILFERAARPHGRHRRGRDGGRREGRQSRRCCRLEARRHHRHDQRREDRWAGRTAKGAQQSEDW